MASLEEIRALFNDPGLPNKIESALVIEAAILLEGTPTANDRAWATHVVKSLKSESKAALMFVLAARKTLTPSAIAGASDSAIQLAVNTIVPELVKAHAGE